MITKPTIIKLVLILFLAVFMEAMAYVTGVFLAKKGIFYVPHVRESYEAYLARRDHRLGWPARNSFAAHGLDSSGARVNPSFPDPERDPTCVSIYGDSFAYGTDVDQEHAWGHALSRLLGFRVANFGVGAYGTDQAYLRYHLNRQDQARIVIFAYQPEGITRNVGQFRNLAAPVPHFLLKPRFNLNDQGGLKLAPIPELSAQDYLEFNQIPEKYLEYDYFIPGGPSGVQRLRFPYTWSILRSSRRFYIGARIMGQPRYAEFYRADHPARGLPVTLGIIRQFYREARDRGQYPLVLIIPTSFDLEYYQRKKAWIYQPLMDQLKENQVNILDLGPGIAADLGDGRHLRLFKEDGGHYNEEGNKVIAGLVFAYLNHNHLISQPTPSPATRSLY